MREVRDRCPRCGRETFLQVDAWSGVTSATQDALCGSCRAGRGDGLESIPVRSADRRGSAVGPLLLAVGLFVAPVLGVVLALR